VKEAILNEPPKVTAALPSAPEKYEDFKTPEGFTLDPDAVPEIHGMFKDMRLPQAEAQRLVDYYSKKTLEAAQAPVEYYKEMQDKWVQEIQADPEIGGSKLDQVKTTIGRALDSLGDQKLANEFRAAMDLTGAGNHPAFVKAFYRFAQKITEGTTHVGGAPRGANERPKSAAQAIYPNLPSSSGG
jgi:hypothetical protein